VDQRARQSELLLHAAREVLHGPVAEPVEAGHPQQDPLALGEGRRRNHPQAREEVDVLLDGELGVQVQPEALRHEADAPHVLLTSERQAETFAIMSIASVLRSVLFPAPSGPIRP
jgi:hypothetical protein